MKVAVIGAGPSGLVTLKYLLEAHRSLGTKRVEAICFEAETSVGGTFFARTYEDAQLVSSKQLMTFSDYRPRENDPDFLDATRYVAYLRGYCTHFQLWPAIRLNTKVLSVNRNNEGGHVVIYQQTGISDFQTWKCDAVAVCSGLHVVPNIPNVPGIEKVPVAIHSSKFKAREEFSIDKTVLVIGSGETGADIAWLAVTAPTRRVVMSHRDGFHIAPQRNLNPALMPAFGGKQPDRLTIPIDTGRASLFDTAYVHRILRDYDWALWSFYDKYVKGATWCATGTTAGIDQYIGEMPPKRHHVSRIFFNKSSRVVPYLSAPYRPKEKSLIQTIRSSIIQAKVPDTRGRQVDLAPLPSHIDEYGIVHFQNNGRPEYHTMKDQKIKPDVVVFCTGYTQEFTFLADTSTVEKSYPRAQDADVRNIWKRSEPSIGFIGFVRPSLGAIPPLSEMQAQLWILNLLSPQLIHHPLLPADEPHYRLKVPSTARIRYGVDHESYVYQLALDMGAALGFWEVMGKGWKIALVWALSANLNTKFRLRGPWRWNGAEEVMVGEMWDMICRRRLFWDHFLLSFLPILIFGPLSLMAYVVFQLKRLLLSRMWNKIERGDSQ